jgi:hypothetical protein
MIANMIRRHQAVRVYEEDEESVEPVEEIQEVHEEEMNNNNNNNNNNYGRENNNNDDENEEEEDDESDTTTVFQDYKIEMWKTAVMTKMTTTLMMRVLQHKIGLLKKTENITMMMTIMIATM